MESQTTGSSTGNQDDSTAHSVSVAIRVRPLTPNEEQDGSTECVTVSKTGKDVFIGSGQNRGYTFDRAFPPPSTNEQIFQESVEPIVDSWLSGYNATVFAYGQTGSGKTFTMGGSGTEENPDTEGENSGVINQVISKLFRHWGENKDSRTCKVKCSYIELYNEQINDLLMNDNEKSSKNIQVRDNAEGGQTVMGVKEVPVQSEKETYNQLRRGIAARSVGSTKMNEQSSRSHAVFTISLEQTVHENGETADALASKLHLVDLAGSERQKKTNSEGSRLKEAVFINRGLLALGKVINALSAKADQAKGSKAGNSHSHVPYRESKLTRLLQDSLGGNSKTLMIACVSPADANYDETTNTLRYAARARSIQNKAIVNRDPNAAEVATLKKQVKELQLALLQARSNPDIRLNQDSQSDNTCVPDSEIIRRLEAQLMASAPVHEESSSPAKNEGSQGELTDAVKRINQLDRYNHALKKQVAKLQQQLKASSSDSSKLSAQLVETEIERDQLKYELQMQATFGCQQENENESTEQQENKKSVDNKYTYNVISEQARKIRKLESQLAQMQQNQANNKSNDEVDEDEPEETSESCQLVGQEQNAEQEAFMAKQKSMQKELEYLNKALQEKEQMMNTVADSEAGVSVIHHGQYWKAEEMEEKIQNLEEERNELKRKLDEAGKDNKDAAAVSGSIPMVDSLKQKLKECERQLLQMRSKSKELARMKQLKQQSDRRVDELAATVSSMKEARIQLLRRMKQESSEFRKRQKEREVELSKLRKEERKNQVQIGKLANARDNAQSVAKRKTEELLQAHRALKELQKQKQAGQKKSQNYVDPAISAIISASREECIQDLDADGAYTIPDESMSAALDNPSAQRVPAAARVALVSEMSLRVTKERLHNVQEQLLSDRREIMKRQRAAEKKLKDIEEKKNTVLTKRQQAMKEKVQEEGQINDDEQEQQAWEQEKQNCVYEAAQLTDQISSIQESLSEIDEAIDNGVVVRVKGADGKKWPKLLLDPKLARSAVWWLAQAVIRLTHEKNTSEEKYENKLADKESKLNELQEQVEKQKMEALQNDARASESVRLAEEKVIHVLQYYSHSINEEQEEEELTNADSCSNDQFDMPSVEEMSSALSHSEVSGKDKQAFKKQICQLRKMVSSQQKELQTLTEMHMKLEESEAQNVELRNDIHNKEENIRQLNRKIKEAEDKAAKAETALTKAREERAFMDGPSQQKAKSKQTKKKKGQNDSAQQGEDYVDMEELFSDSEDDIAVVDDDDDEDWVPEAGKNKRRNHQKRSRSSTDSKGSRNSGRRRSDTDAEKNAETKQPSDENAAPKSSGANFVNKRQRTEKGATKAEPLKSWTSNSNISGKSSEATSKITKRARPSTMARPTNGHAAKAKAKAQTVSSKLNNKNSLLL